MRARYGVDPEALGLTGPNAFADAFDASLRGMQIGENLATNALNRELARERAALAQEQAEQVRRDRAIQATVDTPVGSPFVATGGTASGSGKKKSSKTGTTSGFAPQSFDAFVRGQADIEKLNEILADYDDLRAKAGAGPDSAASFLMSPAGVTAARMPRETGGFDVASGLENPLTRINYLSDVLPTPRQAAAIIRERAGEFNLDSDGASRLVQDYENFYAQRAGQYQNTMASIMQAQRDAAARAAAEQSAAITRGLAVVGQIQDAERRNLPFPDLTTEQLADRALALQYATQAYGIPSGETQRLRSSELAAAAPQSRAALARAQFNEQQEALIAARRVRYNEALPEGRAMWMTANNVTDVSTLSPEAFDEMEAFADSYAQDESDKAVNLRTAQEFFTGDLGEDEDEVPGMTVGEAFASLQNMARRRGVTVNPTDLQFAASEIIRDPSAVARLRRGLVSMPSGASDPTSQLLQLIGLNAVIPADGAPPPTPQTQPQASITETEDGGTVVEIQ